MNTTMNTNMNIEINNKKLYTFKCEYRDYTKCYLEPCINIKPSNNNEMIDESNKINKNTDNGIDYYEMIGDTDTIPHYFNGEIIHIITKKKIIN